jgi:hypothetical protein
MLFTRIVTNMGNAMKTTLRLLMCCGLALFVTPLWAAAAFEGTYSANGKNAKLVFLIAKKGDPFSGKPTTVLVFREKDASQDARPDFDAQMGDLGDALVIRLMKDGDKWDVIGEFAHSALKHSGQRRGIVSVSDVTVANGEISGHLTTHTDADLFDEPLAIDLRFHVKQLDHFGRFCGWLIRRAFPPGGLGEGRVSIDVDRCADLHSRSPARERSPANFHPFALSVVAQQRSQSIAQRTFDFDPSGLRSGRTGFIQSGPRTVRPSQHHPHPTLP